MPVTVEIAGCPASPGIASGPLVPLESAPLQGRKAGTPAEEASALEAAIASALADLARLAAGLDEEARAILEFQIAMLGDEALYAPALAGIGEGRAADCAWAAALDAQIADFAAGGNDYFAARTADLCDLRDRVLRHLLGADAGDAVAGAVLAGHDVTPTRFLETDWSRGGGIVLSGGSASSHVAMLARSRGVPMVVGLGEADFSAHAEAVIDGATGLVVLSPDAAARQRFAALARAARAEGERAAEFARRPAVTRDGTQVAVLINVAGLDDLRHVDVASCDGIGLMRTEFLYRDGAALPDEESQVRIYRRLLEWAQGRPVTIRTLDAGGDKPVAGLTLDGEANPFLGVRGIRLSFLREEVFRAQLRALARAAVHGPLKVMWPMITLPEELARAESLFEEEFARLSAAGIPAARPELGMMVEVPAPAIAPDLFAAASFFSIGSNDLIQYVAAAARDNGAVAPLAEGVAPVVLRLIERIAAFGREKGIEVSLCGDLASDPAWLERLVRAGLRSLSVAPAALGRVKAALGDIDLGAGNGQD